MPHFDLSLENALSACHSALVCHSFSDYSQNALSACHYALVWHSLSDYSLQRRYGLKFELFVFCLIFEYVANDQPAVQSLRSSCSETLIFTQTLISAHYSQQCFGWKGSLLLGTDLDSPLRLTVTNAHYFLTINAFVLVLFTCCFCYDEMNSG
jgi:hypothetical protein